MKISEIWNDLREVTGTNDPTTNYRALSLGLEWLANEKLFDPMVGYVDFTVDGGYSVALPREVKTPLRININNNPSFHRSRLYEFATNSDGSVDGEEVGYTWSNRGYSKIQDERNLPSKLRYVVDNPADAGKTLRIRFYDEDSRFHDETLIATNTPEEASETSADVHRVEAISRQATLGDGYLIEEGGETVARYYNDETLPEYRVIKLSKTGVAIRMMFRRHAPQNFSSQEDLIPFNSRLAIIWAAKTVRLLHKELYEMAEVAANKAREFANNEQSTRDEGESIGQSSEAIGARNSNINTFDSLIVADIYDDAAEIFGPIGREKILDKIGQARDLLANKSLWDATVGNVDIWKPDTNEVITPSKGGKGTGIFTLPRYVGAVLAVRPNSTLSYPRNGWFEFHMNGTGENYRADVGTWDMLGTACIIQDLLRDEDTRKVIPVKLSAVCLDDADEGKTVTVFGLERLEDGREVEVYRNGAAGYTLTMATIPSVPASDAPNWVEIRRIKKDATTGFAKLITVVLNTSPTLQTMGEIDSLTSATAFHLDRIAGTTIPVAGLAIEIDGIARTIQTATQVTPLGYNITLTEALPSETSTELGAVAYNTTDLDEAVQDQTGPPPIIPEVAGVDWIEGEDKDVYLHFYGNGEVSGEGTLSVLNADKVLISQQTITIPSGAEELTIIQLPEVDGRPFSAMTLTGENLQPLLTLGLVCALRVSFVETVTVDPGVGALVKTMISVATYDEVDLLGYYYPDELEPQYKRIKVHSADPIRCTIRYRARMGRPSLFDPLHLKSPLAIIEAMRSMQKRKDGDYAGADSCEATALRFLQEKEFADHPTDTIRIQFDSHMTLGGFGNIR